MKAVYEKLLKNIPDYKEFLTADEMDASTLALAAAHPESVSVSEIGKSRDGHPLLCLKIGNGSHNALMFGCPHPNEPIGCMMLEYFTKALAEDEELRRELDYTWYVVKAWDNDGVRLNEGWLKGPYTIYNYSRNFFRPAGHKQVDWTWPIDYKEMHFHAPLPEVLAMQKLIDEVKPSFIYSLHNAGFGGVYWYMAHGLEGIYEAMRNAANKLAVPLNLGEPEAPYCKELSPAVYGMLTIRDEYDYIEKYVPGANMAEMMKDIGTSSSDYAWEKYKSFTFLTELPYFYDRRIDDMTPSSVVRRDAVLAKLDFTLAHNRKIHEILDISKEYLAKDNPFYLTIENFTRDDGQEATRRMVMENEEYAKLATVAEEFDNGLMAKFYASLTLGMLVRANEYELEKLTGCACEAEKKAALTKAFALAEQAHKALTDELEAKMDYEVVPIWKLISIQLECGLLVAEELKEEGK